MPTMTPEQWQRVREVVDQVLERPADERKAYIKSACGDDAALLAEALKQLRNHEHLAEVDFMALPDRDVNRSEVETPDQTRTSTNSFPDSPPTVLHRDSAGEQIQASGSTQRFETIKLHARGGLGEVFRAKDHDLGREVALKEIRRERADDEQARNRFIREAKITGRLEHPGIVPIYGCGRYDDGRPYYAMRMVGGQNLNDAIKEFHAMEGKDRDRGQRTLELRKLLGRFIDVCQAIRYAHSRGIIHRDIKPGNILLGPYGETLIVDWGLAKIVGRPEGVQQEEDAETTQRPHSTKESQATAHGYALGTPEFMSPEQASGWLDKIGPASDIYSLGATLYCLLTGRPSVTSKDADEIVDKARRGDWQPARKANPTVARPLDAICQKAMAQEIDDRYESA
ncbi:MAG: serine/threonine protein kinase [Pirellulales bacterium]|nr:serine/threonine protein kinase [Pirellulales bacterium]